MKIILPILLFLGFFFIPIPLRAEIENVTIRWDPLLCNQSCYTGLEKRLAQITGVQSVKMYNAEGRVDLVWKQNIPFSFVPINWALRYIGVRENEIHIKVTGKITHDGKNFSLVSNGDRTIFVLFNPVTESTPNIYVTQYNKGNRELSKELIAELMNAKKKNSPVTIDGSLFMPERSPPDPLQLIIEKISVQEKK